MSFVAKVAIPKIESKKLLWDTVLKSGLKSSEIPFGNFQKASSVFHHSNYPDLMKHYVRPYFDILTNTDWVKYEHLTEIYFGGLFPLSLCNDFLLQESQNAQKRATNLTSTAKRYWMESEDELRNCIKVRDVRKQNIK
jgi:hypothetical protein